MTHLFAVVKIWNSGYPKETEKGLVNCDSNGPKLRSVIQNDDADQQNPGSSSRDMGDDGTIPLLFHPLCVWCGAFWSSIWLHFAWCFGPSPIFLPGGGRRGPRAVLTQ